MHQCIIFGYFQTYKILLSDRKFFITETCSLQAGRQVISVQNVMILIGLAICPV